MDRVKDKGKDEFPSTKPSCADAYIGRERTKTTASGLHHVQEKEDTMLRREAGV